MAARLVQLDSAEAGLTRLRIKGGANKSSLYDLLNGYVDSSGSIQSRDGTVQVAVLPAGTIGLCSFRGELVVFGTAEATMPAGFRLEILTHPTDTDRTLREIHYAGAFLGYLYVVAEWDNGDVFHYWLQRQTTWKPNTFYDLGELVEPTIRNGYAYRATRLGDPGVVWAPNVSRAMGDVIEPTGQNGYQYTVTNTIGADPRSGDLEPTWPTEDGATVDENTDVGNPGGSGTGNNTPPSIPPPEVTDRYGNPAGNRPPNGIYNKQEAS